MMNNTFVSMTSFKSGISKSNAGSVRSGEEYDEEEDKSTNESRWTRQLEDEPVLREIQEIFAVMEDDFKQMR